MGNLTPGATYIYESPDGGNTVYAREQGQTERILIGYNLSKRQDPLNKMQEYSEIGFQEEMWADMFRISKDHPALQNALDHCKITYHMIKDHESKTTFWHPV
jgi:hypothetical protein